MIEKPNGTFEGRYVVGYKENGYPITKSVFAKTKTECKQKLKEAMERDGKAGSDAINPEMTFGDWLQFWYNTYCKPGIRESTMGCYESRINLHILPALGDIKLNKLTENDLQQFYTNLKKGGRIRMTELYGPGLSDRMVRSCHATCRAALEKAKELHLISRNPAIGRKPERRLVLQIIDTKDQIAEDRSIDSFIAGFRLAWRLSNELNMYEKTRPLLTPREVAGMDAFVVSDKN